MIRTSSCWSSPHSRRSILSSGPMRRSQKELRYCACHMVHSCLGKLTFPARFARCYPGNYVASINPGSKSIEPRKHVPVQYVPAKNGERGKLGQERLEVGWEVVMFLFNIVNLNVWLFLFYYLAKCFVEVVVIMFGLDEGRFCWGCFGSYGFSVYVQCLFLTFDVVCVVCSGDFLSLTFLGLSVWMWLGFVEVVVI